MNKTEIVSAIELMSQESGFIYTYSQLLLSDLFHTPDEVADLDWRARLNAQELSFLTGLMVKRPIDLADFPDEKVVSEQTTRVRQLFDELHDAIFAPNVSAFGEGAGGNTADGKEFEEAYRSLFGRGGLLVEPMFYGGSGAYDFQFLEMAESRYRRDAQWLAAHLGTPFETIIKIARRLGSVRQFNPAGLDGKETFEESCRACLSSFTFTRGDLSEFTENEVDAFLHAFVSEPGKMNEHFDSVSSNNEVLSHPVIRLESDTYFLPIGINLAQSIYESPFYWALADSAYKETFFQNRGDATEELARVILERAFGKAEVHQGVKIRKGKRVLTDIDVLAVAGNKVVIVQAKSKKLTELSRRGDQESIEKDFQNAVQTAYEQALVCRTAILNKDHSLTLADGSPLALPEAIDDAYIICVTGDHYPALTRQTDVFLKKAASDPHPLAMSIFDLDVVTFYLDEPFDLLYYLRLRSTHAKFFFAQSEVALLAFHLNRKLLPPEGRDFEDVPESLAQLIDANYPVARGFVPKTDAADKLVNQWKNPEFNRLVTQVKEAENRGFTDALFFLFDLAGEGADTLIDIIVRTKASSKRKGRMHDASMLSSKDKRGITVASFPDGSEADMAMLKGLAMARKYKSKADEWLALGSIADSSNLVDGFGYSKELWESDSELDEHAKTFLKPGKALHADGRRIGRNERCPCRSVLKYKKCHGK